MKCLCIIACIFLLACNTPAEQDQTLSKIPAKASATTTDLAGCYQMFIGKDSAFLEIFTDTSIIHGKLKYKRFEKDSNDGTFEGVLQNNVIKGWYIFNSEGVISVREIFLKIIDNTLAEGYGDLDMKGDTAFFSYPTTVTYEDKHPFIKVTCTDKF